MKEAILSSVTPYSVFMVLDFSSLLKGTEKEKKDERQNDQALFHNYLLSVN